MLYKMSSKKKEKIKEDDKPIRRMPIMDKKLKEKIRLQFFFIREKIRNYEEKTLHNNIEKAIKEKDKEKILEELKNHKMAEEEIEKAKGKHVFESFIEEILNASNENEKKNVLSRYEKVMKLRMPTVYEIIRDSIERNEYPLLEPIARSKFSYIGDSYIDKDAVMFFVFSGGAARGSFYKGFIKAMKESNIWPDYVIGSSAGALASAHLAYNDENVEKILNEGNIAKAFSLTRNFLTPIISFGNGIAGYSFYKLLKKAFNQTKMKDVADCFIVTVVPPWRTNVIGCSSNGEIMFSKDMLLANAVYASCSIPGIIKQYCEINVELNKLWFENDELKHAKTIKEYAMFEDGAVTQPLPIITALTIARKLNKKAFIIAINLNELNPIKNGEPYFKLKEIINILKEEEKIKEKLREKEEKRTEGAEEKTEEKKEIEESKIKSKSIENKTKAIKTAINKIKNGLKSALTTIKIYIEAIAYFIKQKKKIMISKIAPIRAFNAYKVMETHSIINILRNVKNFLKKGEGLIIINPNANGELEGVKLNDKKGMEKIAKYGYEIGKEFASILLLKNTHENRK